MQHADWMQRLAFVIYLKQAPIHSWQITGWILDDTWVRQLVGKREEDIPLHHAHNFRQVLSIYPACENAVERWPGPGSWISWTSLSVLYYWIDPGGVIFADDVFPCRTQKNQSSVLRKPFFKLRRGPSLWVKGPRSEERRV